MMKVENLRDLIFDQDIDGLSQINRWSLNNTINKENVAEHSFYVSHFCSYILNKIIINENLETLKFKSSCLEFAINHDLTECLTGDINHNIKYNSQHGVEFRKLLADIENNSVICKYVDNPKFVDSINNQDKLVHLFVKISDWMSCIKFVNKEVMMGNKSIENRLQYCVDGYNKSISDFLSEVSDSHLIKNLDLTHLNVIRLK